jgi:hypothetical protein
MAAGDIVVQMTNMTVVHDEGDVVRNVGVNRTTVLFPGTLLKPVDWQMSPVTVILSKGQTSVLPASFFDGTKQYKLTIEEV